MNNITDHWDAFRARFLKPNSSDLQVREMHIAYVAGAFAYRGMLVEASQLVMADPSLDVNELIAESDEDLEQVGDRLVIEKKLSDADVADPEAEALARGVSDEARKRGMQVQMSVFNLSKLPPEKMEDLSRVIREFIDAHGVSSDAIGENEAA